MMLLVVLYVVDCVVDGVDAVGGDVVVTSRVVAGALISGRAIAVIAVTVVVDNANDIASCVVCSWCCC